VKTQEVRPEPLLKFKKFKEERFGFPPWPFRFLSHNHTAHERCTWETAKMKSHRYSGRLVLAGAATLLAGCAGSPAQTSQVTYENTIHKVVAERCAECHGANAPSMADFKKEKDKYTQESLGPRMDTYENLMVMVNGSDTGAIMRRLDDGANSKDGKPGNMYKHLGKDDAQRAANLALFKRWVGSWNLKKGAEISEEERKAVLAPRS
jgi:mono/diheme cytochrome c family protein